MEHLDRRSRGLRTSKSTQSVGDEATIPDFVQYFGQQLNRCPYVVPTIVQGGALATDDMVAQYLPGIPVQPGFGRYDRQQGFREWEATCST